VFITDGTQSSLDVCLRAFADQGDTLWIEHPGYGGALAAGRGAGLQVTGIAVDMDGIAPTDEDWRDAAASDLHHAVAPVSDRQRAQSRAPHGAARTRARGGCADHRGRLRQRVSPWRPALAAMQGLVADAPVVYLGTFSKTMFPALRIAFIVVPQRWPLLRRCRRRALHGDGWRTAGAGRVPALRPVCAPRASHAQLYRQRRDALGEACSAMRVPARRSMAARPACTWRCVFTMRMG
jgi:GntR family transcriptional regulator/MocR family aminotransferase